MESPFIVRCEDGAVRHEGTFATRAEAEQFAYWGHCCTVRHTYVRVCIVVPNDDSATLWDCACSECRGIQADWHRSNEVEA